MREYDGAPLRVTLQTTVNDIRQTAQAMLRGWWREIGVETTLLEHDSVDFFGDAHAEGGEASYLRFYADLQMYATDSGIDPQGYLSGGLCAEAQSRENGWTSKNNSRACSPGYDALYAELASTPLGPQRDALVRRLNDAVIAEYREIPLVLRGLTSARASTLEGVAPNGWDSDLWNIGEWRR